MDRINELKREKRTKTYDYHEMELIRIRIEDIIGDTPEKNFLVIFQLKDYRFYCVKIGNYHHHNLQNIKKSPR